MPYQLADTVKIPLIKIPAKNLVSAVPTDPSEFNYFVNRKVSRIIPFVRVRFIDTVTKDETSVCHLQYEVLCTSVNVCGVFAHLKNAHIVSFSEVLQADFYDGPPYTV